MEQFGTSEEEAYTKIQLDIEETWKDINQEMIQPTDVPVPLVTRVVNLARVLYDFYQIGKDGYTMSKYLQPKVAAILVDPIVI